MRIRKRNDVCMHLIAIFFHKLDPDLVILFLFLIFFSQKRYGFNTKTKILLLDDKRNIYIF